MKQKLIALLVAVMMLSVCGAVGLRATGATTAATSPAATSGATTFTTLACSPAKPLANQPYTLSGTVKDGLLNPLVGVPVQLSFKFPGDTLWTLATTVTTVAGGAYTWQHPANAFTGQIQWQAKFPGATVGGTTYAKSTAYKTVQVSYATHITLTASTKSAKWNSSYTLSGTLTYGPDNTPVAYGRVDIYHRLMGQNFGSFASDQDFTGVAYFEVWTDQNGQFELYVPSYLVAQHLGYWDANNHTMTYQARYEPQNTGESLDNWGSTSSLARVDVTVPSNVTWSSYIDTKNNWPGIQYEIYGYITSNNSQSGYGAQWSSMIATVDLWNRTLGTTNWNHVERTEEVGSFSFWETVWNPTQWRVTVVPGIYEYTGYYGNYGPVVAKDYFSYATTPVLTMYER